MTRQRNFDSVLREWVDLGDERLPLGNLDAALAEIETTPQRGHRPLEELMMRLQPFALPIAVVVVAVIAVAALAVASQPPSVGPQPSVASAAPSTPGGESASEAIVESIAGPVNLAATRPWLAKSRDSGIGQLQGDSDLSGYQFSPDSLQRWFTIYLDPEAEYGTSVDTDGTTLWVAVGWNIGGDGSRTGTFASRNGECTVTFSTFSLREIAGSLECEDIPGTYSDASDPGTRDGVISEMQASFSVDPVADVYEVPQP